MIDHINVRDIFDYCDKSGELIWKVCRGSKIRVGMIVGSIRNKPCGQRYKQMRYNGKFYLVHRVVWLWNYGCWPDKIDHINRNGIDNRISNLRDVTNAENQRNRGLFEKNKSGINGVWYDKKYKSYRVYIGRRDYLGLHKDFFEACCIRKSEENKRGFHENHGH